uniref:UPF0378 protein KIAA0100 n=1 Tax=Aceria tosichella TaxID=561515 RepID=A0A6G1S903_9ACAR
MELLTLIFTLFIILPLTFPFIISRFAIYCLAFYLKRYSITLSVAKCGLFSFRTITVSLPLSCMPADDQAGEDDDRLRDKQTNDTSETPRSESLIIKIDNLRFTSLYLDNSCTSILSICLNNTTILYPESQNGQYSKEIRIKSFEFPIDKIRGDFIRHYKENFNISLGDIIIPSKNFTYEIQKVNIRKIVSSQRSLLITFSNVRFCDLSIPEVQTFSEKSEDPTKQRILFIDQLQIDYTISHHRVINLNLHGDCFLRSNLEFYLNFIDLINSVKNLVRKFRRRKHESEEERVQNHDSDLQRPQTGTSAQTSSAQILNLKLILSGKLQIGIIIDENQLVCAETSTLEIEASFPGQKTLQSDLICVTFEEQATLACAMVSISYYPSPGIPCIFERKQNSCGYKLYDDLNALLNVDIETVNLTFPYKYDFSAAFNEKLMGIFKWLKKYHKNPNKKKRPDEGPVDFDIGLRVNKVSFEIEDDPFEIRMRTNYMLLEDEYHEQLKRDQTLQDKINELKRTNLMLASSIVEELNRALAKKNSDIYIQRSKQLYTSEVRRVPLFSITIDEADLKILADSSFHKHDDITSMIINLNPECPPTPATEFSTLWCRILSANFKSVECNLRDFTLPMLSMNDLTFKGMILGTEQVANARARRSCQVYVGRNSAKLTVERSMTPLKIFHNLQIRCTKAAYTHGPCWEPVLQQVSLAFEDIVSASSDPSPSLPWWDKMRFIFHGHLKLNCNHLSVFLHASNNPYNHTELIELNLSRALIELTTGKIRIKGDFDVLLRTASKYDECRFIRIPNFDSTVTLEWNCLGNPHDHLSITPCAPDKVPDYSSHLSHDSYRSFRSQSLNLNLNLETQFTSPTSSLSMESMPSMLFFGSTIRWLENQKFIFVGPSKLTRRGKLFNNTKPKKPSLSRIFKEIRVTISLNRFQILYWSSVSKRHGIHMMGGEFSHCSEHTLKLVTESHDGLKHRPQANWQTIYMNSSLANVEVWLYNLGFEDLDEFNEFNTQANYKNRQYFISFSRVSYNKEAQLKQQDVINDQHELSMSDKLDSSTNADVQSTKSDEQIPNHRLVVHDLKAAWTKENRDVIVGIFDAFVNSQQLKRNLSTEALKPIRIESTNVMQQPTHQQNSMTNSSPPHRHQRHPSTTSLIVINQQNQVSSISKNRAVSMLQKLIADSENNPNVYTEETHSGVASDTHLYGVEACQMDDVVDINCLIELVNSQVMLCGTETPGYVIVSAANTEIRQATHLPVWKNKTLLSKTTWTGSLRCMQYYATVDGQGASNGSIKTTFTSEHDIQWLEPDNIDSRSVIVDYPDLVGSGHSVGGVVSSIVGKLYRSSSDDCPDAPVQLQRIISRCNCLFYYASHTVGVPDDMQHLIPPLPDDEMFIEPWDKEVGVDSFTLTHQDLDISTNSQQYAMIMDIINNLLLFVEPHKKTAFEKLERMRFRFQLSADEDQREPISQLQDQVRRYVAYLKRLERERYLIYRASIGASIDASIDEPRIRTDFERDRASDRDRAYRMSLSSLSEEISTVKEQLNSASEELAMMISCYKEIQLGAHKAQKQQQAASQHGGTGAFFANVIRRNEICFKSARWRVTDSDGQLGLADIVLSNFLYSKVVKSDDSVEHTIELGHLHVSNLIPNQAYKDVLHPTELQANIPLDRHRALRIYCRELAPVAGIPVKEHLEINVVPFTIEVTLQFFQKMVKFFFPEREAVKEAKRTGGLDLSGEHQFTRFGSKKRKDVSSLTDPEDSISTVSTTTMNSTTTASSLSSVQRRGEEIEKMRERAAKNHTFVYVKIPGIPIKVSYKGKKQKSVTDLKNMSLTLPTYEYHNSTWTWLDLLMAVKNDSKHTVIKQALKQKMKIRPSSIWSKSTSSDSPQQSSDKETSSKEKCSTPVTDEDKARLLLGQYAKKWISAAPGSAQNEADGGADLA